MLPRCAQPKQNLFPRVKVPWCRDSARSNWVTQIVNRLYDITGDVTSQYHVIDLDDYSDTIHKARLTKQCIEFEM